MSGTTVRTGLCSFLTWLAAAAALLACGDSPAQTTLPAAEAKSTVSDQPTAEPTPDAESSAVTELGELLRRTDAAMASVSTGRSVVEVEATIEYSDSQEQFSSRSVGDFQAPDRSRYKTVVDAEGFSLETETITVGTGSWTRVTSFVEGPWEPESKAPTVSVLTLGLFDMRFGPETEAHFDLVGKEELNGEAVFHLKGEAAAVRLPNVSSATDLVNRQVEYWISADVFLVRRAVLHSEASFAVPTFSDQLVRETVRQSSDIIVTLSEYGKTVDIQAPEIPDAEEPTTSG